EGAGNRHRESVGIEPVICCSQDHRPFEVRIPVGYVGWLRSLAGAGIIETNHWCERKSGLSSDDPIPLPAPDQTVQQSASATAKALSASERQLIAEIRVELVSGVIGGDPFIQAAIVRTDKVRRLILP